MKIAIIGAGISGLGCAYALSERLQGVGAQISVFEQYAQLGGHANTVTAPVYGGMHAIDTGFLVYNERTYPLLIDLFTKLQVPVAKSDMSFSVQNRAAGLEWSGSSMDTVFTQRRNLMRPAFLNMLLQIVRFNKDTTALAEQGIEAQLNITVGDFLRQHGYSQQFIDWYFLPMIAAIWSCPVSTMMQFPMATMIRFCHNHGLLQVNNRPQWFTVEGGSRVYVNKLARELTQRGVHIHTDAPVESIQAYQTGATAQHTHTWNIRIADEVKAFDHVVFACHSDQALRILSSTDASARTALAQVKYQPNHAILHTDASVLPRARKAWAAWNYESTGETEHNGDRQVALHYLINKLQPLKLHTYDQPVVVTLNPTAPINRSKIVQEFEYDHPVFDQAAIRMQQELASLQGQQHLWFCGAWMGYGFHEDGLKSGYTVAHQLAATLTQTIASATQLPDKLAA